VVCPIGGGYHQIFIAALAEQRWRFGSSGLPLVLMIVASSSQMSVIQCSGLAGCPVFRSFCPCPAALDDMDDMHHQRQPVRDESSRLVCSQPMVVSWYAFFWPHPTVGPAADSAVSGILGSRVCDFIDIFLDVSTHELGIGLKSSTSTATVRLLCALFHLSTLTFHDYCSLFDF